MLNRARAIDEVREESNSHTTAAHVGPRVSVIPRGIFASMHSCIYFIYQEGTLTTKNEKRIRSAVFLTSVLWPAKAENRPRIIFWDRSPAAAKLPFTFSAGSKRKKNGTNCTIGVTKLYLFAWICRSWSTVNVAGLLILYTTVSVANLSLFIVQFTWITSLDSLLTLLTVILFMHINTVNFHLIHAYFSYLRVLLILIYLVPFSLSSSPGAGLGKRTQKLLGAHQDIFNYRNEREHSCVILQTELRFLYWKFNIVRSFTSMHHFIICVASRLSFI